jgi:DNA modification methylase
MKEKEGVLFSAEEMNSIEKGNLWSQQQGPVKCLGMEFENDDARRTYFREELRKKLPELRKIEGFPIGEDNDIVNLSDPPYYTACPNPWLNDFVAEWEKEKEQLEREGKRKADFEVKEPYASDVSEGKNNPVYTAHTYHTKCPHPAIMRYILQYTQPGDIVLDGFAGTGMTGAAAAACSNSSDEIAARINGEWLKQFGYKPNWGARHAVIGDLSPYATNIAYFYNTPINVQKLRSEVERIKEEMENECGWMYTTFEPVERKKGQETVVEMEKGRISFVVWSDIMVCPACGQEYVFWHQAVDHEQKCMLDEFHCPHCHAQQSKKTAKSAVETYFDEALQKPMKRIKQVPVIVVGKAGKIKIQRPPTQFDLDILKRIEETKVEGFFPTDALPEGYNTEQPKKTRHIYHVHQFYTRRNLISMSRLYEKIEKSPMALALRFMFTGMIHRSASMQRVIINYYFNGGGGWNGAHLKGTLYIPNVPTETSVLEQIDDKLGAMIRSSEMLAKVRPNVQYVGSADSLQLEDNSVDYIFTDPPFGSNINYSELNSLPEPWLKVVTNNSHEAIENVAQGKDAQHYRDTMSQCFKEYYRVLKPGKWMTVEFSNTSAAVWNSIQSSLQYAGFIVANVSALDKKQGSFKAVTTTTAVKQDLVITCYKPSKEISVSLGTNGIDRNNVWEFVNEHLSHLAIHIERNSKTTTVVERSPKILYDRLISYYVQHGYTIPIDAQEFQKGLSEQFIERDGMFFTVSQAAEYMEKRKHTTGYEPLGLIVSDEANGIEWLKINLKEPKTYQEISPEWMQTVKGVKKGDVLPELMDILQDNFIKDEDGKWHVPDLEKQIDLQKLRHNKLIREFNLIKEQALKPRARIKEVHTEAVREGFKQCFKDKDFQSILLVGDKIPQNILTEDEVLLQYYDIAQMRA